jgi:hypothetical protein
MAVEIAQLVNSEGMDIWNLKNCIYRSFSITTKHSFSLKMDSCKHYALQLSIYCHLLFFNS